MPPAGGSAIAWRRRELTRELRKVHQFNTFSIVSPLQYAIARYLSAYPDAWQGLSAFFQAKRDLLAGLLRGSGFEPVAGRGHLFSIGRLRGDSATTTTWISPTG